MWEFRLAAGTTKGVTGHDGVTPLC